MTARIPDRMIAIVLTAVMLSLPCAAGFAQSQSPDIRPVHDPSIIEAGGHFFVFSTGRGVPIRESDDLFNWRLIGHVFEKMDVPDWAAREIPGARSIWAPDIHFVNGQYRLYYAVSTLGSRRSAIGFATNVTLDPLRADYHWQDHGKVIETTNRDDFNAIDPDLILDQQNRQWLVFGSYWTGIKMRRIDAKTGMTSAADPKLYSLARRPDPKTGGAIEGPFVIHHGDFYYLFVSFGTGVNGLASTYNIRVGRAADITGPYLDLAGRDMRQGGGTLLLCSYANVRGPGHCGIVQTARGDFLAHHFYDMNHPGHAALQIRPLMWDADGWPLVGDPPAQPINDNSAHPAAQFNPRGTWMRQIGFGQAVKITFDVDGQIQGPADHWRWNFANSVLILQSDDKQKQRCLVDPSGSGFVGRTEKGALVRGWRID